MMTLSVREFDRRQSNSDVNRQLAEERKANDVLRAKVERLTLDHQGCSERSGPLQADLDEARRELAETKEDLKASRALGETLSEDVKKLKVEVRRVGKRGEELAGQSERLSTDLRAEKTECSRLATELVKVNE